MNPLIEGISRVDTPPKYKVKGHLRKKYYSKKSKAVILRVNVEFHVTVRLFIPCPIENSFFRVLEVLDEADYWKFICYDNGEVLSLSVLTPYTYFCTIM